MKTLSKQLQALVVVLFGFIAIPAQASLSYTANFDINQLDTTIQIVDGVSYMHLEYPDLCTIEKIGVPELPIHYLRFSVPYNATNFTVSINSLRPTLQTYTIPVYPVQPPIPANFIQEEQPFVAPDSAIYNSRLFYPASPVEIVEEGFLGGDNHIVTVALYPITYAPLIGKVKFYNSISITLNYTISNNNNSIRPVISRKSASVRQRDISHVEQMVVNPTQVESFAPILSVLDQTPAPFTGLPAYQYCVVTSRELAPAFDRLIAWKRQKGYTAGVVCVEDILAHPNYQEGDVVPKDSITTTVINDDAGKLRSYLREAYQRGITQYALLAGDYSVLPIRYGCEWNYSETSTISTDTKIPTDLYFSDLNSNWNKDNDLHYGEPSHDNIDYCPEIYVGRLLCTNTQEITNYTEKLFKYEQNPGNGDWGYLKKVFYSQCDQPQGGMAAQFVQNAWDGTSFSDTIFEELPSHDDPSPIFPSGTDVINEMNNRYGFFSWHGHGNPGGIGTKSPGNHESPFTGILALQGETWGHVYEEGNGLDNLTNQDYPAIAYSTSCTVTPFDIFTETYNNGGSFVYNVIYNVGSSFTVAGSYGGPAFLGNTRSGYRNHSLIAESEFIRLSLDGCSVGVAEGLSKPIVTHHYTKLTHSLIGCPEFEMWTDIPVLYDNISIQRTDNGITISSNELTDSKVAYTLGNNQISNFATADNTVLTLNQVSPNSAITIYKHNAIPYIAPLYWQNDTITGDRYLLANQVTMGKAVDTNRTIGEIVLNGGTTTLDSKGMIQINEGTVVENNAHLVLKNNDSVTINGGIIQNGGKLTIEGPGDVMIYAGTIRNGGILNLEGSGKVIIIGGVVESGGTLDADCEIEIVGEFEIKDGANVELR